MGVFKSTSSRFQESSGDGDGGEAVGQTGRVQRRRHHDLVVQFFVAHHAVRVVKLDNVWGEKSILGLFLIKR